MRIKAILLILPLLLSLLSCGSKFIPFAQIPDANLDNTYFNAVTQNFSDITGIYNYLVMKLVNERSTGAPLYDLQNENALEAKEIYERWKTENPAVTERIDVSAETLATLVSQTTYSKMEDYLKSMQLVIENYVNAAYLNDANLTENISDYVSEDFLSYDPISLVEDYLSENNIRVKKTEFNEDSINKLEFHVYPYLVGCKYKIYYYIGDIEPDEKKLKEAEINLHFFISCDNLRTYMLEYISMPEQ